jgi:asparagine synthase (glutamine-hydrolysing)
LSAFGASRQPTFEGCLFVKGEPCMSLSPIDGAIVGTLVAREGERPLARLLSASCRAVESTGGRHLLDGYWGAYVALWRDARTSTFSALRDPSAAAPLYLVETASGRLLCSDIPIAIASGWLQPAIAWSEVARQLAAPQLATASTCLDGVREILPGERVTVDANGASAALLWSPWRIAEADHELAAPQDQLDRLRGTVIRTTCALAEPFDRVQLELSGGLDSSILAGALRARDRDWWCTTFATAARDGDERGFARLVATAAGVPLDELSLTPDELDPLVRPTTLRARPTSTNVMAALDTKLTAALDQRQGEATITGNGGDNVFGSLGSAAPVLDAIAANGWRHGWRVAKDLAAIRSVTNWAVMRTALWRWSRDYVRRPPAWISDFRLLAPQARLRADHHPWLDDRGARRAGRRAYVASLLRAHVTLDCYDRASQRRMLTPLLAQPVVECCLSFPTWQWMSGGRDRSAARAAFADLLPPEILARRGKGRLESILVRAYDNHRTELRALLLDGLLAGAGLLDRRATESALAHEGRDDMLYLRLLDLADAEIWARHAEAAGRA